VSARRVAFTVGGMTAPAHRFNAVLQAADSVDAGPCHNSIQESVERRFGAGRGFAMTELVPGHRLDGSRREIFSALAIGLSCEPNTVAVGLPGAQYPWQSIAARAMVEGRQSSHRGP
jgi:hypothetical protein